MLAEAEAQRHSLAGLLRSLASARPEDLPALRAQIAAATAASAHLAQHANPASGRTEQAELDAARDASRQQVRSLLRDMHRFDPYLNFASPEDEEAYRRRETERRTYIEQQHARGTPQGDLNAAGATIDQMADAGAHGAARSPEFQRRFDELTDTTDRLRAEVRASGRSTEEFDDRLRETLRSRGMSDLQIDARLAANSGNPVAALRDTPGTVRCAAPATPATAPVQNIAEAMAEFRAAGILSGDHAQGDAPAHGLTTQDRPAPAPGYPPH